MTKFFEQYETMMPVKNWRDNIPTKRQVDLMLSRITNKKHRLIFLLVYSGLNAMEVSQLKTKDIGETIKCGKKYYRITSLTTRELRAFAKDKEYVFGISRRAVELAIEKIGLSIGIRLTVNYLRNA